jgi:agmatine/peptidylarginine deiminase
VRLAGGLPVPDVKKRFPPEWAPQSAVMLTWPHDQGDWGDKLEAAETTFVAIAQLVSLRQKLIIVCRDSAHCEHVSNLLESSGAEMTRIFIYVAPSNDIWSRDHGPITVVSNGEACLLDFRFDGWGGKYPADKDDHVTRALFSLQAFPGAEIRTVDRVLEGGSIDTDGMGTILTTEQCLLRTARNPGMDKSAMEALLKSELGASRILWLTSGRIAGDDTDSHVDTLARFCSPDTICYSSCEDSSYSYYDELLQMKNELRSFRDPAGRPYHLVPLPIPVDIADDEGRLLPATYVNFLIMNGAVLVPVYGHDNDALAVKRLGDCFPDRDILTLNALPLLSQFGSIHCAAMQLPAEVMPG